MVISVLYLRLASNTFKVFFVLSNVDMYEPHHQFVMAEMLFGKGAENCFKEQKAPNKLMHKTCWLLPTYAFHIKIQFAC